MSADRYSILVLGEESGDAARIRQALGGLPEPVRMSFCRDVEESLRLLEQDRIEILFVDAAGLNGGLHEVIARIKSRVCEPPAVVVLSVRDRQTGDALLAAGACEYLLEGGVDASALHGVVRSLRERRKLTRALAASEERYASLLRSVTDYTYTVVIRDNRPITTSHSPGCASVTGYAPEDYHADPQLWFRMIHDGDREAVLRMVSQVFSGMAPAPLEHRILHKCGDIRWIRNTPMPRYDQDGALVAYDGLVTDITARKQAEQALRESEARYRTLVDTTPDAIFLVGRDLRLLFVNEAGRRLSGAKASGLAGQRLMDLFPQDVARRQEELVRSVFSTAATAETDLLYSSGRKKTWNFARLMPLVDDNGSVYAVLGVVVDITERKQAEEALRESEQRLQRELLNVERAKQEWEVTFDALRDPILIHDRDYRIVRANRSYQEAAGLAFRELIGKPFHDVFPKLEEAAKGRWRELQDRAGCQPYFVEDFDAPSLKRVFRVRAYPVADPDGTLQYAVQVFEDVTETRQEMEISANLLALADAATETMDMDRLLERIVSCCGGILASDAVLLYLRDRRTGALAPQHAWGLRRELLPMFRTEPLDGASALLRETQAGRAPMAAWRRRDGAGTEDDVMIGPMAQNDRQDAERTGPCPLPWLAGMDTVLAIPLVVKNDVLGFLLPCYRSLRSFTDRDRLIVHGISRQVSLAVNEAYLYRTAMERSMELAHKMETLKVIREIDLSILSSLQPREILEAAVRNVSRIVSSDRAEALLLDREKRHFTRICVRDGEPEAGAMLITEQQAFDVIGECRPRYLADLGERRADSGNETSRQVIRSLIMLPLIVKGDATGVLSVGSRRPAAFTPEHLETLEQLADQIGVAFDNTRLFADLEELFLGTVKSLSRAIDAKSSWTAGHSERVTRYAQLIGRERGYTAGELRDLELAGLLHDVGKLGIFDAILDKKSSLDPEEFIIIKRHPVHGAEMLRPIRQMERIIPAVRHHHERYDGMGYPDGLKGEQIPSLARVLAVADAFDSMTGWRPYRKTFSHKEAVDELCRCSGTQFDPLFVEAFVSAMQKNSGDLPHAA